jgi:hypothetical protein
MGAFFRTLFALIWLATLAFYLTSRKRPVF